MVPKLRKQSQATRAKPNSLDRDTERARFETLHDEHEDPAQLFNQLCDAAGLEKVHEHNNQLANVLRLSELSERQQGVVCFSWDCFTAGRNGALDDLKKKLQITDEEEDKTHILTRCAYFVRFPDRNASKLTERQMLAEIEGSTAPTGKKAAAGYQAAENGAAADPMVPEQAYEDAMASAEEARLWGVVTADCLDFDAWTALIEETERIAESNIVKIRKVYDAFLAEFPLCFGYWKKYADHEGRLDGVNKVFEVYERAVLAVTYSVDIWCNYCQFAISTYNDPDVIRRLFDRGLAYVGTDYRSNTLWDEYIKYEESLQAWNHLAAVYTRILEHPIQQLDRYFNCLKELTATRSLSEILTAEETSMYCLTVENSAPVIDGEAHPNDVEKTAEPEVSSSTEAEDKAKYVSIREELYKKAKEYESKIISFEQAIRRPYFHVKPLDKPELENWHSYLDFMEREEDINKVIKLYERCVIACASYSEFWIRYVQCMEDRQSLELANNALARATHVFVKKQTEIHLFNARFKELNGDTDGARAEYQHLHSLLYPGLLEAIVKHANMEHRLGDKESACLVYEKAIAAEKEKEQSQFLPMLLIQYSRFLYMICDLEKAREVSGGLHGLVNMTKPVLEAVIFLESIFQSEKRIDLLESLVEKFLTTEQTQGELASLNDKEELSSIYLEFLDTFGDIQLIKKATTRHTILFSRKRSILPSKKRRADDAVMSGRDKMAKTGDGTQPVMGTDPNAHNPAVWPATSEASAQQWGAAYAQQAAYPAYGAYDYSQQMPQSAPQAAAYGAYPPTYPAQAYPQQSYAQPAAMPVAAPVPTPAQAPAPAAAYPQQPAVAAAPQAYYGSAATYY